MAFAEITGASALQGKAATAAGMPPLRKGARTPTLGASSWPRSRTNNAATGQQTFGVINIGLPYAMSSTPDPTTWIIRMPTAISLLNLHDNEPVPTRADAAAAVSRGCASQRRRLFGSAPAKRGETALGNVPIPSFLVPAHRSQVGGRQSFAPANSACCVVQFRN